MPLNFYCGSLPKDTAQLVWSLAYDTWQFIENQQNPTSPKQFEPITCVASPNPTTSGLLHVEIKHRLVTQISIRHISGVSAFYLKATAAPFVELDLSELPKGMYYLIAHDNFGDRYELFISRL
jgi:hypothetical protein